MPQVEDGSEGEQQDRNERGRSSLRVHLLRCHPQTIRQSKQRTPMRTTDTFRHSARKRAAAAVRARKCARWKYATRAFATVRRRLMLSVSGCTMLSPRSQVVHSVFLNVTLRLQASTADHTASRLAYSLSPSTIASPSRKGIIDDLHTLTVFSHGLHRSGCTTAAIIAFIPAATFFLAWMDYRDYFGARGSDEAPALRASLLRVAQATLFELR